MPTACVYTYYKPHILQKTRVDNNVETYMRIILVELQFSLTLHRKSRISIYTTLPDLFTFNICADL